MKIKNIYLGLVTLLSFHQAFSQADFSDKEVYKVVYGMSFNSKQREHQNKIWIFAGENQTLITTEKDYTKSNPYPIEFSIIDRKNNQQQLVGLLNDTQTISAIDTSLRTQKFEYTNETKKILGYTCRKATTVVNSNKIELWYTTEISVKGAPSVLGQNLGMVLETIRNGNAIVLAESVEKQTPTLPGYFTHQASETDLLTYKDELWKSRFITVPLFTDQIINFSDSSKSTGDILRFANGTIVVKKVQFPKFKDGNRIFLDVKEQSNGDAYDRTGTVFLISTDKKQSFLNGLQNGVNTLPIYENGNGKKYQGVIATSDYDPAIELMRFFTPFGIHQYNYNQIKGKTWQDAALYRQDISAFASLLNGKEVYIGIFVGNYDKGGHKVTANITIHNEEGKEPKKIVPLFNTLNIMEMASQEYATMFSEDKGVTMTFELKEPVKNAMLRYITTGHGGWGGGDEFVQKVNTILLDNNTVFQLTPWREECGCYRLYNPATGNFNTGLSSSDLSRSNWCPGTVTNPYIITLGDIPAGKHTLQVKIPQGKPEGTSFSYWNVSGVIVGD